MLVETQKLAVALHQRFATEKNQSNGPAIQVAFAMRYGNPAVPHILDKLKAKGMQRLLVLPAYPQYSATTTASVADAVNQWLGQCRNQPEVRFIKHYHDHPAYIEALARHIERYWQVHGRGDRLVMSFHGVPLRTLELGDPYHCECYKTARLLRERLGLEAQMVKVTFQSRLGRAQWLQPYTEPSLVQLAQEGIKRVDVVCPGFISDCLETLEEIAIECKLAYTEAGGEQFQYIPCLNDDPQWVIALHQIASDHCAGWPAGADAITRQASRQRALALGANDSLPNGSDF